MFVYTYVQIWQGFSYRLLIAIFPGKLWILLKFVLRSACNIYYNMFAFVCIGVCKTPMHTSVCMYVSRQLIDTFEVTLSGAFSTNPIEHTTHDVLPAEDTLAWKTSYGLVLHAID